MASEWRTVRLGDVAERVAMGPFGSSIKVETFVSSGVPVISGQHLRAGKVDDRVGFNFISEEHADRLRNANVQRGDVIFTHAGNIGQVAYIPESSRFERYVISQRQFYMRCNPDKILPEFVVAYFKTPEGRHQLLANTSQVGVPSIAQPVTYLRTIEIPLPPLSDQHVIARVLGVLDDKIELNRRLGETLEEIATTLFKSWFVDFDPVRAKAAGRDVGLPNSLAEVFPARLVDSELGEIPNGWQTGRFTDLVEIVRQNVNPFEQPDTSFRHFSIPAYDDGQWPKEELGESIKSQKSRVLVGSVLVSKLNPEIDRTWLVDVTPNERAICSTEFLVLQPRQPVGRAMIYCIARTQDFRRNMEGLVTGTSKSHQRVHTSSLLALPMVRPSPESSAAFEKVTEPLLARSLECRRETHTLATLRDTLLPKLISGELRLKDLAKSGVRSHE